MSLVSVIQVYVPRFDTKGSGSSPVNYFFLLSFSNHLKCILLCRFHIKNIVQYCLNDCFTNQNCLSPEFSLVTLTEISYLGSWIFLNALVKFQIFLISRKMKKKKTELWSSITNTCANKYKRKDNHLTQQHLTLDVYFVESLTFY